MSITDAVFRIFAIAAIISTPLLFIGNMHWIITPKGIALILWLGLIPTALAYMAYAYGFAKVRTSTASTLILAEPATATPLAALVLGEAITAHGGWEYPWLLLALSIYPCRKKQTEAGKT